MSSKTYQFSLNSNLVLSDEQQDSFEENGYIIIKKLINEQLLDQLIQRFDDICNGKVPKNDMTIMKEKSLMKSDIPEVYKTYKVQDFVHDEVLSKYVMNDLVLDYVEAFVGPNIKVVNTMVINKPPDSGLLTSRHPLHQDLFFFPFRPENKILTIWTAMEDVTPENGCLFVLPKTHKLELYPHDYPKWENSANFAYYGINGFDFEPRLYLPMHKGDTIMFHPKLIHGSGANMTKGFRKAITCHYASSDCYFIPVQGTIMENAERDMQTAMGRRGIGNISFQDYWRYKSYLVRGLPGKL